MVIGFTTQRLLVGGRRKPGSPAWSRGTVMIGCSRNRQEQTMEKKELGHRLRRVRRRKPLLLQALIRPTQVAVSVFFAVGQRRTTFSRPS